MAGTLSVQKIQGLATSATPTVVEVSSGHELHTNTLKGTTTAGSITVQGEGTATTNLQQGLVKVWARYEQDGTNSILDSFNVSGLTDEGNGDATVSIANDMGNINYSPQVTMWYGSDTSTPLLGVCGLKRGHAPAAGSFRVQVSSTAWDNGAVGADVSGNFVAVLGDLA